jgi:hypothetical protein
MQGWRMRFISVVGLCKQVMRRQASEGAAESKRPVTFTGRRTLGCVE